MFAIRPIIQLVLLLLLLMHNTPARGVTCIVGRHMSMKKRTLDTIAGGPGVADTNAAFAACVRAKMSGSRGG